MFLRDGKNFVGNKESLMHATLEYHTLGLFELKVILCGNPVRTFIESVLMEVVIFTGEQIKMNTFILAVILDLLHTARIFMAIFIFESGLWSILFEK